MEKASSLLSVYEICVCVYQGCAHGGGQAEVRWLACRVSPCRGCGSGLGLGLMQYHGRGARMQRWQSVVSNDLRLTRRRCGVGEAGSFSLRVCDRTQHTRAQHAKLADLRRAGPFLGTWLKAGLCDVICLHFDGEDAASSLERLCCWRGVVLFDLRAACVATFGTLAERIAASLLPP